MRALLFTCLAVVGSSACTDDLATRSSSHGLVSSNRLAANRLAANRLAANRLAANRLAANRLAANRLAANLATVGDLLKTPDGREVLSFIVSCALPEDVTLVADFEGVHYEFPGEIGLAPEWEHAALNLPGQHWVSACLFARVNANDVALPISMRGPHRALETTEEERTGWSVEEGAFYGQFFRPIDEPIVWIACRGEGQASGEFGGLVDRDCAEPDPAHPGLTLCGFQFAGDCGDFAPEFACEDFREDGTYYRRCHETAVAQAHRCGKTFREVITTFVTP